MDMLRPSRSGHERISQQEVVAGATTDNASGSAATVESGGADATDVDRNDNSNRSSHLRLDSSFDEQHSSSSSPNPEDEENDLVLPSNISEDDGNSVAVATVVRGHQREMYIRRQSMGTLLVLFFLFKLWILAIIEKDVGLIFLSVTGTIWTYRWLVTRREVEEEMDRQLQQQSSQGASEQAQLALAILESQQSMIENEGYGGNDINTGEGPGVTDEARAKWKRCEWGANEEEIANLARRASATDLNKQSRSDYGSVSTILTQDEDDQQKASKLESGLLSFDEEPSCSICLCEYENKENIVQLPCGHVFHKGCIDSWVEHNTRCPLCNTNLMEGFVQPASVWRRQQQNADMNAEIQRAFRSMALWSLVRSTRRSS